MTEQSDSHHDVPDATDETGPTPETTGQWRSDTEVEMLATDIAAPHPPGRALAGRRVLVADDESVYRQRVSDMLSECGCRIDMAHDGAEACELLAGNRYDLVISDISMAGATGYDVFAAAKAANHDTGVILMTAFDYDPNHSVVKARKEGTADVLLKPFQAVDLLNHCHGVLAGAEA